MSDSNRFGVRDVLTIVVMAGLVGLALWLRMGARVGGTVVDGEVVAKREAITMPLGDSWRRVFEISYRYRTNDSNRVSSGQDLVDAPTFDRLRVGSRVKVTYKRAVLGNNESALADGSWMPRLPQESESSRELSELGAFGLAIVLGVIAYRRETRWLGVVAAITAITVACSVFLFGFIVFPVLFWVWWRKRLAGVGWVLVVSAVLSTIGLYYRVPKADPPPAGEQAHATAVVRTMRTVDRIWESPTRENDGQSGQGIRNPFQMVDLEFTPAGAAEPVHALDRVDAGSVPGLAEGARLPITYSVAQPRSARIDGGTRDFGWLAFVYLIELTYGIGAALAIAVLPLYLIQRLFRRSRVLTAAFDPVERAALLSQLGPDDPRRKELERRLTGVSGHESSRDHLS